MTARLGVVRPATPRTTMLKTSGLISPQEAAAIERSLERVIAAFPGQKLTIAEIGLWDGTTSRGIRDWFADKGVAIEHHCFDSGKESPATPYPECTYHLGDSLETVPALPAGLFFHWALVDGCHCASHAAADTVGLGSRVWIKGEMAVHDTSIHLPPTRDYQGHGPKDARHHITGVRYGLNAIGMLPPVARAGFALAEEVEYPKYDGRTGVIIYRRT